MLKDFSIEKMDLIIEEWKKLGNIKSLKQTNELLSGLEKKLKELELNDVDEKMLEIKSKILNKNTINSEKSKLKKKIDDYTKLIAQLENNLNLLKVILKVISYLMYIQILRIINLKLKNLKRI